MWIMNFFALQNYKIVFSIIFHFLRENDNPDNGKHRKTGLFFSLLRALPLTPICDFGVAFFVFAFRKERKKTVTRFLMNEIRLPVDEISQAFVITKKESE